MPTPLDLLLDPISLTVFAIFGALILWEALAPARTLPRVPYWRWFGLAAFAVYFLLSSYLPLLWGEWLAPLRSSTWRGSAPGAARPSACWSTRPAPTSTTARSRLRPAVAPDPPDAPQRRAPRTFGAFWFSPLDMVGWTLLSSVALTVVGLSAEATTVVLLTVTLLAILQHANVRTPYWLGYVVQRPESHSFHHERGVHARNYADLPVFDLLFGSFFNPRGFAGETGFYDGASRRIGAMLAFRDVAATVAPLKRRRPTMQPAR